MNNTTRDLVDTGRLLIGSAYVRPSPQMSNDAEAVKEALMAHHRKQRSHIIGSSRDLHKLCVGRRSMLRKAKRVARELMAWLCSPRAW